LSQSLVVGRGCWLSVVAVGCRPWPLIIRCGR
jgi:hypothetical protein